MTNATLVEKLNTLINGDIFEKHYRTYCEACESSFHTAEQERRIADLKAMLAAKVERLVQTDNPVAWAAECAGMPFDTAEAAVLRGDIANPSQWTSFVLNQMMAGNHGNHEFPTEPKSTTEFRDGWGKTPHEQRDAARRAGKTFKHALGCPQKPVSD